MKETILIVDIKSDWHAGGGRGAGAVLDAVVHKDNAGLPVLPGRHIKGLLRDACQRAEGWGWAGCDKLAETLFGQMSETHAGKGAPAKGCLRVSDARLPRETADWLGSDAGRDLRLNLFRGLYATAIDHTSGTADDHSLRGIEVTIPLRLEARITPVPGMEPPPDWKERLARVLPLIDAVGAYRTRGLGRAELTLKEVAA